MEEQVEYISLGKDCCIAYHLEKLGLRKHAYPFDWLKAKTMGHIYTLIKNDFLDFLNPTYLKYKNNIVNSFLVNDINDEYTPSQDLRRVVNIQYKIDFMHDFVMNNSQNYAQNLEKELETILEKYIRRIQRFYQVMKDENIKKKLFYVSPCNPDFFYRLFIKKGFKNFSIYNIHCSVSTKSWKREELNIENQIQDKSV
jgi:hypothetical protein